MENVLFESAWRTMLDWLGTSERDARPMRAEVVSGYRAPGRAYHNLSHALRVLKDVKTFAHWWGVEDYGAVQLAALLHDVVYDTRSQENEARSAEFVTHWGMRLGMDPATCALAAEIVLATRDHKSASGPDAELVLDADLAVLAAPWAGYEAYRRAIRREYQWVTEADWAAGRSQVLTTFLERDQIYHVPALRETLEASARKNIARELSLIVTEGRHEAVRA